MKTVSAAFTAAVADPTKAPQFIATLQTNVSTTLDGAINDTVTTVSLTDASSFPSAGVIKLNEEYIRYESKSSNDLLSCTRGHFKSTAASHSDDDAVWNALVFASHAVAGRSGDTVNREVLRRVSGTSQKVTPNEGTTSHGSISFTVLDVDGFFTTELMSSVGGFRDKEVRVLVGFDNLTEDEFEVDFSGFVKSLKLNGSMDAYLISAGDIQRLLKGALKTGNTKVRTSLSAASTIVNVTSTTDFAPTTYAGDKYFKIGDEIIQYATALSDSFTGCTRGALGTTADTHDVDDSVDEIFEARANPITIALSILTSTGDGTNGTYDTYPANKGLGIEQTKIDITTFENERDEFFLGTIFRFRIDDTEFDAKDFIEAEILRGINGYFKIRGDGKLSLKINRPALPTEDQQDFTDSNIKKHPSWDQNLPSVINDISFNYDHDVVLSDFLTENVFVNATSVQNHGNSRPSIYDLKGVHTTLGGVAIITGLESSVRLRFQNPAPMLSFIAQFGTQLAEVGDIVNFSNSEVPDISLGRRGVTNAQYEIVSRRIDYLNGTISYTVLDTNRSGKICVITPNVSIDNPPSAFPDFGAATESEKRFGFISDNNGLMADGSAGCIIL